MTVVCRHQALVPAPAAAVWSLVGNPERLAEWSEGLDVQGRRFGHDCDDCRVSSGQFAVEQVGPFREISVRCAETGLFTRWVLTEAQDGTFVDAEFGWEPGDVEFDARAAKRELRRWLERSLDALAEAATPPGSPGDAAPAPPTGPRAPGPPESAPRAPA